MVVALNSQKVSANRPGRKLSASGSLALWTLTGRANGLSEVFLNTFGVSTYTCGH